MEEDHGSVAPTARRNLNLALSGNPSDHVVGAAQGEETNNMAQNNPSLMAVPPLPPAYVSPREVKKAKNSESPGKQNKNKLALLAG